ncbi:MAG TPA: hypothetical protein VI861_04015, partial [Rickettsiales bacterium]|nr:hypothetical protein [Rickettsiales bacterium]
FEKSRLVAANATFQAIGSSGAVLGCLLGGIFIQFFDFYGFFIIIISINLFYLFLSSPRKRGSRTTETRSPLARGRQGRVGTTKSVQN